MVPSELSSCGITSWWAVACKHCKLFRGPSDSNEIKLTCVTSVLWIKMARFVAVHFGWRSTAQLLRSCGILNKLFFTSQFYRLSKRPSPLPRERQYKFIILNRHIWATPVFISSAYFISVKKRDSYSQKSTYVAQYFVKITGNAPILPAWQFHP